MNYVILGKGFISPQLKKLKHDRTFVFVTAEELSRSTITFSEKDKVYVPTEAALQSVLAKMTDKKRKNTVAMLKDKFACRTLLRSLYPSIYFAKVTLDDLASVRLEEGKKYVVKPQKGFFSAGVRVCTHKTDMKALQQEISAELAANAKYFNQDVLSTHELLLEEYIAGEEFAVDMFYSSSGKPVITNIYLHPEPKNPAYSNVLYYSNTVFFSTYLPILQNIFATLNTYLQASSFPIHAEFKYYNNTFIPIEFNPMRFGGMGLCDLTYYAYHINPFLAYFHDTELDWNTICDTGKNTYYAWVLGYNGTKTDIKTEKPNHEKFRQKLGNILHYNKLNYKKMPVFANAYIAADRDKIAEILRLDFNDYFGK